MIKHIVKVEGTIGPKPGYSITSFRMPIPGNLYAQGEAYLEAAIALGKTPPRRIGSAIPLFFCIAQASELFLKSFLAAHGKDRKLLGWKQHDLVRLQSAALRLGMILKDRNRRAESRSRIPFLGDDKTHSLAADTPIYCCCRGS
jgi:hypothetical protein